jgi:hypothetical protein
MSAKTAQDFLKESKSRKMKMKMKTENLIASPLLRECAWPQ